MAEEATEPEAPVICDELHRVISRRFLEARRAGLTRVEARMFAESEIDVGELRRMVKAECPPGLIARLLF